MTLQELITKLTTFLESDIKEFDVVSETGTPIEHISIDADMCQVILKEHE